MICYYIGSALQIIGISLGVLSFVPIYFVIHKKILSCDHALEFISKSNDMSNLIIKLKHGFASYFIKQNHLNIDLNGFASYFIKQNHLNIDLNGFASYFIKQNHLNIDLNGFASYFIKQNHLNLYLNGPILNIDDMLEYHNKKISLIGKIPNIISMNIVNMVKHHNFKNKYFLTHDFDNLLKLSITMVNMSENDYWLSKLEILELMCCSITKLSGLPSTLKKLNCSFNHGLHSLGILPDNILWLNCSNTSVQNVDSLPKSLLWLDCSYTAVTDINNLPIGLIALKCNSKIKSLDYLPESLIILDCRQCNSVSIDNLPIGLKYLCVCDHHNQNINNIPPGLEYLCICGFGAKSIGPMPHTIKYVVIGLLLGSTILFDGFKRYDDFKQIYYVSIPEHVTINKIGLRDNYFSLNYYFRKITQYINFTNFFEVPISEFKKICIFKNICCGKYSCSNNRYDNIKWICNHEYPFDIFYFRYSKIYDIAHNILSIYHVMNYVWNRWRIIINDNRINFYTQKN